MLKNKVLNIKNYVHKEDKDLPLVGIYNKDYDIKTATSDRSSIVSKSDVTSRYNTYVGGNLYGILDGAKESDFNSMVFSGIEFDSFVYFRLFNSNTWTPKYLNGMYSIFNEELRLYSSYHCSSIMKCVNGAMEVELREDCDTSSLEVCIWRRNKKLIKLPYIKFGYTEEFATNDRKYQYMIKDNKVFTDREVTKTVGCKEKDRESVRKYWENKYRSNSKGRLVYTDYFPIKDSDFELIAMKDNGDYLELKEVKNLDIEDDSEYIYQLDRDLGIVNMGGVDYPELFLLEDIDKHQRSIRIINKEFMDSYPPVGVIHIGNEKIYYADKSYDTFLNCTRGVKGTSPASHSIGEKLKHIKNGKSIGSEYTIYCRYTSVPKIRYETSKIRDRFANSSKWLNLKPINNIKENGIIQISNTDKHVSSIVLEIEADYIFSDMYGPIYYGTDFKKLTARALDSLGNPVDEVEITIDILQGPGFLNYSLKSYSAISNIEGEIYTLYGVPYDWESIGKDVYSVSHTEGTTRMKIEEIPGGLSGDVIQIYQVHKHDPVLGTSGKKMKGVGQGANLTYSNGELAAFAYIEVEETMDGSVDKYEGGFCYLVFDNGVKVGPRKITQVITSIDTNTSSWSFGEDTGMVLLLESGSSEITNNSAQISYAMVFEREAVEFSTINMRGCRRVLYEWRDDVKHPLTETLGAYYPVRPDFVSTKELNFNTLLPIPEPDNDDSNLGGYIVVCSDFAAFQARCKDPVTGNIIKSNKLKMRIDIPPFLDGVSRTEGLKVPYGFKLITEDFNHSSAIGGATFLSINPLNEDIIDLSLELS